MNKPNTLFELREAIDEIDLKLLELISKRLDVVSNIAAYKKEVHLPIVDLNREKAVMDNILSKTKEELKPFIRDFFQNVIRISKERQQWIVTDSSERK